MIRWWDNPDGCVLNIHNRYTLINSRVAQNVFAATVNSKGKICMAKKRSFLEIMDIASITMEGNIMKTVLSCSLHSILV